MATPLPPNLERIVQRFQQISEPKRGLVGLLLEGLNGATPSEILALTPDFIQQTGLDISLTPSRSNGFYNIFRFMQAKVAAFQTTVESH